MIADAHITRCAPQAAAMALVCFASAAAPVSAQRSRQPEPNPLLSIAVQTCVGECHQDQLGFDNMHGPVVDDCAKCHIEGNKEEHTFFFVKQPEELCIQCHARDRAAHIHEPAANMQCLECHDAHGSDHPSILVADPKGDLCARCHQDTRLDAEYVHGPVVVGACVVCHEAHASEEPALLRKPERDTCLDCHPEVDRHGEEGWHTHQALEQGCTGCHDPHAADHQYQLKATAPDLCMTCHEDALHDQLENAAVVHGALTQEHGCTGCHEAHGSMLPKLRKGSEIAECLSCHNQEIEADNGRVLPDMSALLTANTDHHGPIREGLCTTCHQPHVGDRFGLLVEEYPPEFYAPFDIDTFKLCFRCHIPDLVLQENGRGLTNFRQGDQNLHWLHVNQEKGRTCRACHEVHASSHPKHIRDAVPFGESGWMLELNFTQSGNGGSCTPGCHKERSYRRGDNIDAPPPTSITAMSIPKQPAQDGD